MRKNIIRYTKALAILVATLLPILNILHILSSTAGNNVSNDDLMIISIIDRVLSGTYQWKYYFRDAFFSYGHYLLFPTLLHILTAKFARWNVYILLYFGMLLGVLKLTLLQRAFTHGLKSPWNWVLWPILSALLFSNALISSYGFDFSTIQIGLSQFGFAVAIWGMTRFRDEWKGIGLMVTGGILASWSHGAGPFVWPAFLLGMLLLGFRRRAYYLVWAASSAVVAFPFFYYLILHPKYDLYALVTSQEKASVFSKLNLGNYPQFLQSIGWPFSYQFSLQEAAGIGVIGLALLLLALIFLILKKDRNEIIQSAPAVMVLLFGIFNVAEVTVLRGNLVPWYSSYFILFWVGLVGLGYVLWVHREKNIGRNLWSIATLSFLLFFYFTSNLTYVDKATLLLTRSPVSAACLRNYKTAPTYCEKTLWQWELGQFQLLRELGGPLERHQMSVFAPRQTWTLQGDFILGNVIFREDKNVPPISWSTDLSADRASFYDFRHLNLFLHTPNEVEWTFKMPEQLKKAVFHSAVAISQSAPLEAVSDGVNFKVTIEPQSGENEIGFSKHLTATQRQWIPFEIDLSKYAGQTITLRLGSEMGENYIHDWAMYRFPFLDLDLDLDLDLGSRKLPSAEEQIRPSNTELGHAAVGLTQGDYQFNLKDSRLWQSLNMTSMKQSSSSPPQWNIDGNDPILLFKAPLNICLSDYKILYIKMAASENIYPRYMEVTLQIDPPEEGRPNKAFTIPLLEDGGFHEYTLDLKLLELDKKTRITGIRLDPVPRNGKTGESTVQISDFRFIRNEQPGLCKL